MAAGRIEAEGIGFITRRQANIAQDATAFRLRSQVSLGDRIEGWRVCWLGGWDKSRIFFVVMVQRKCRHYSRRRGRNTSLPTTAACSDARVSRSFFAATGGAGSECKFRGEPVASGRSGDRHREIAGARVRICYGSIVIIWAPVPGPFGRSSHEPALISYVWFPRPALFFTW
jgi:hypothetical protein